MLAEPNAVKAPATATATQENAQVYKIPKKFDAYISAVCLGINLRMDGEQIMHASIGISGVAATLVRTVQTEAALRGQPLTQSTIRPAIAVLRAEFTQKPHHW